MAHCLLNQTALEMGADIVLISEPLYNPGPWIYSSSGSTAIWVTGNNGIRRLEDGDKAEQDFTAIRLSKMTIVSTYFSPNISIELFAYKVKRLIEFISQEIASGNSIVVGGDFNAKSPAWGSKKQNTRGTILLEELIGKNIFPCIPEGGHTFERGKATSNLDFIATTQDLQQNIYKLTSKILNVESASDHKYILTDIKTAEDSRKITPNSTARWKVTRTGLTRLGMALERTLREQEINEGSTYNLDEENKFLDCIYKTCDEAFDKADTTTKREKTNCWWTPEIRRERVKTQRIRRAAQKARKKGKEEEREALLFLHKLAKKNLQRMISQAKEKTWKELCESIDKDIWGKPYKAVIRQVKKNNPPATLSLPFAATVMDGLFPQEENLHEESSIDVGQEQRAIFDTATPGILEENLTVGIPEVTTEEILQASKLLKPGKAPGIDGMQPEILKAMVKFRPDRFAALFNGVLTRGFIPQKWKRARTILLRKEGKDPSTPSAYRPICILDAAAKMFEYVIRARLYGELGEKPFNKHQFGFTKGTSTVHAMEEVRKEAIEASKKNRFAAMIALDVKNAFNSLSWTAIHREIANRNISEYLARILKDYFRNRTVKYDTPEDTICMNMKKGVPQGSVLGPFLWNLVYDGLLRRPTPPMCKKIAFADDIAIIAQAATVNRLKIRAEEIVEDTRNWMASAGLVLAESKTEIIRLNGKGRKGELTFKIGEVDINPTTEVKYLGLMFDSKKNFRRQTEMTTNKAIKTMSALSRIMTNAMKTRQAGRRLYYMTMESIVLYGAPIWAEASRRSANRKLLRRTQKIGLTRVVSAYRSVPLETLAVLSGVPPWELKIKERREIFDEENKIGDMLNSLENRPGEDTIVRGFIRSDIQEEAGENAENNIERARNHMKKEIRKKAKEKTADKWQDKWNNDSVGRWTHRLIPNIERWINRRHGGLNFYLTQALTGHGVFNSFRQRIGKAASGDCWYHPGTTDTPEHTLVRCQKWSEERKPLIDALNARPENLTIETIMEGILAEENTWRLFANFCKETLRKKEEEERKREKEETDSPLMRETEQDLESVDRSWMADL